MEKSPVTDKQINKVLKLSAEELVEKSKNEDELASDFSKEAK